MLGRPTIGVSNGISSEDMAANQVIVFMASGLNTNIQLPIAYHFIKSLDAQMRSALLLQVINALIDADIQLANIVFDGYPPNQKMCELLGANLDVLSKDFKPYFEAKNGDPIMILLDICHMEKLVRNTLGKVLVIYDDAGDKIEWDKYVKLVEFKKKGFAFTHKLNDRHINFKSRKMKVSLAAELLSGSVADSMEYLMKEGHEEFQNAAPNIKFNRIFNDLFDCFNSKQNKLGENVLKNPLCEANHEQIFSVFENAKEYIKKLEYIDENGVRRLLVKSKLKTGFIGYIISMCSLQKIYEEFVVKKKILKSIPVYDTLQDPLEFFLAKTVH